MEFVAALTAEELVAGNAESLALDVPERNVDRGHASRNDRAAALPPEGLLLHLVPDEFGLHRVEADDDLGKVLRHSEARRSADAVSHADFAEAADAFIGIDADNHRTPLGHGGLVRVLDVNDVNAHDLHDALSP